MLEKLKNAYLVWVSYYQELPKTHRYSLGTKIDNLFIETIEALAAASFSPPDHKLPFVRLGARKFDTLKLLLMVLWETKALENKKYIALSEKLAESGRMIGGWHGKLAKENSPDKKTGEKRKE